MKIITAIVSLLLPLGVLACDSVAPMPPQFIGHWAGSLEGCNLDADEMVLHISADRLLYWESEGQLLAVVSNGEQEVALIMEMAGEGDVWLDTALLHLSEDGSQLTDETSGLREPLVRYRCPQ